LFARDVGGVEALREVGGYLFTVEPRSA
jgi:hypothetical protein